MLSETKNRTQMNIYIIWNNQINLYYCIRLYTRSSSKHMKCCIAKGKGRGGAQQYPGHALSKQRQCLLATGKTYRQKLTIFVILSHNNEQRSYVLLRKKHELPLGFSWQGTQNGSDAFSRKSCVSSASSNRNVVWTEAPEGRSVTVTLTRSTRHKLCSLQYQ